MRDARNKLSDKLFDYTCFFGPGSNLYWPLEISINGPWGEECAFELLQYWNQLKWSDEADNVVNQAGVTWTELALDFLLTRKVHIPTNPPKVGDPKQLERNNNVLRNNGWAFFHVVKSFFYLARWLDKMLGGDMFQNLEQGAVTSLQKQGAVNRHHGIKSRPKLIHQQLVIQEISSFRKNARGRFSGVTERPFDAIFWDTLHICV